jgi:uncharacterized protein (TIGR03437 family)
MKLIHLASLSVAFAPLTQATVVTLGASAQNFTLTGLGITGGNGVSRVTPGTCAYNGATTTCVLSGPYTGLGSGGAWQFTLTYPGDGPSPLTAVTSPPSNNLFYFNLSAGSVSFTLTPAGGNAVQFYDPTESFLYSANAFCSGVSQCSVSAVGQSAGGTIAGPVTGSFDATPVVNSVISASAYGGFNAITPATWIEIYGTNLATVSQQTWAQANFTNGVAPSALGGSAVTVNGQPAYVDYVSPHQVNVQVPSGIPTGKDSLVVTTFGGASAGTTVTVNAVEPGILAPSVFDLPAGQYVVALFPNGATYALPPGVTNAVPTQRAVPGNTLMLYGIGFGPTTPSINAGVTVAEANNLQGVQVLIGGQQAVVQYAGLVQGFLGLYQFNVVVPNVSANDATPVTFSLNGTQVPQTLLLPVGN